MPAIRRDCSWPWRSATSRSAARAQPGRCSGAAAPRRNSAGEDLNVPNIITLGRLLSVPLAIWLILSGAYLAAFWTFVFACVSDAVDGFIAKRFDMRTQIGALLDPIADKVLLVSVYVTLGIA